MTRNGPRPARDGRARTVSISLRDRGQTTQDFAVGIGVFILAVAFVFSFLPTLLTPFDSSVTGAETAQADRIADRVVHNLSAEDGELNAINGSVFYHDYVEDDDGNMTERLGLRDVGDQVNIRLEHLNGSEIGNQSDWKAGSTYRNQSAASSARLVTVDGLDELDDSNDPDCAPTCRLIVRIW